MRVVRAIPTYESKKAIVERVETKLGKRSRFPSNFIAEGQENEEPSLKKRVSPVDEIIFLSHTNMTSATKNTETAVPTAIPTTNSTTTTAPKKFNPRLTLEMPPPAPIIPHSLVAAMSISWAPEDDETYAWTIFEQKLAEEALYVLDIPVYDCIQTIVTPTSHNCMFNFLCEIAQEQRLSYATFLHAMHIFDFVLSRINVGRNDFLLTGCTCMMLAAKLEEIYPPTVDSLMSHSNYVFSKAELYQSERMILELLHFKIARPTRLHFAEYLGKMQKISKRQGVLLQYLIGLTFLDFDLNYFKSSVVAAAALIVTFQLTNPSRDIPALLASLAAIIDCPCPDDIQRCVTHIRYVHHIAQTGPDALISVIPTPSLQRTNHTSTSSTSTANSSNGTKQPVKSVRELSPQLIDWFHTEETFNVTEITALPLFDLDLSLLRNRCTRSPRDSKPTPTNTNTNSSINNSNNNSNTLQNRPRNTPSAASAATATSFSTLNNLHHNTSNNSSSRQAVYPQSAVSSTSITTVTTVTTAGGGQKINVPAGVPVHKFSQQQPKPQIPQHQVLRRQVSQGQLQQAAYVSQTVNPAVNHTTSQYAYNPSSGSGSSRNNSNNSSGNNSNASSSQGSFVTAVDPNAVAMAMQLGIGM